MTKKLKISDSLSLPPETITDTIGVLAVKGAGKSYTCMVLVEEMIRAHFPVVILDPVGVFWGLRQGVDGDPKKGLDVLIFGGRNGDVPLEATAGKVIADIVIAERRPVVLDTSAFETKADQLRFVKDFATRLYHANRDAIHIVIDEADDVAPQKPLGREEPFTLRAIEVLVRRGRARGIGVTLVTQRSAALNKGVLTQVSTLVLGRTVSPQDRKAIEAWIDAHATEEQHKACMASLASLPTDEKWIWSPLRNVFKRVKIRDRITFDSSATPKLGASVAAPKLAPIDLESLKTRIAATIEKAKADDPRSLRARVKELEQALAKKATTTSAPKITTERVEIEIAKPFIPEQLLTAATNVLQAIDRTRDVLLEQRKELASGVTAATKEVARGPKRGAPANLSSAPAKPNGAPPREPLIVKIPTTLMQRASAEYGLRKGERNMLVALARHHGSRITRAQLGTLVGIAAHGTTFGTYLSTLKRSALVDVMSDDVIALTDLGLAAAGGPGAPMTRDEVLTIWLSKLRAGERKMLEAVVHETEITRTDLGTVAEIDPEGTTFGTYLSTLKRNDLVVVDGDRVRLGTALAEAS